MIRSLNWVNILEIRRYRVDNKKERKRKWDDNLGEFII